MTTTTLGSEIILMALVVTTVWAWRTLEAEHSWQRAINIAFAVASAYYLVTFINEQYF